MGILTNFTKFDHRLLFVETGTGDGATLAQAARYFDRCVSMDWNLDHLRRLEGHWQNVTLYPGHSQKVLPRILRHDVPTLFWLDAHYTGNGEERSPYGECPLLDELGAIANVSWKTRPVILVDDAFMFDDAVLPPVGFDWTRFNRIQWPRIEDGDAILTGYHRTLDGDVFRYDEVTIHGA